MVFRCTLPVRRRRVPLASLAYRYSPAGGKLVVAFVVTTLLLCPLFALVGCSIFFSCIPSAFANAYFASTVAAAAAASCIALDAIATSLALLANVATTP